MQYLAFIEKTINKTQNTASADEFRKTIYYAKIMIRDGNLQFEISDKLLANIYSTKGLFDNKTICSLKWLNTRNEFSAHILESLLHYQRKYWYSGRDADLKPLTLKQFLSLYPLQYLEQTRLSRLIMNLSVTNCQNQLINLKSLFISKKRRHSFIIKEIVKDNESALKDRDIQCILAQNGIHLTLRTICNCRKLLNIPNYKERDTYYEKDIIFSNYILLSKRNLSKIPHEPGVYEMSVSSKVDYPNHRSNTLYIGCSNNLRKRIDSYTNNKMKNDCLKIYSNNNDLFVRYYSDENHRLLEKEFLKNFAKIFGGLPKANSIGG